MIGSIKLFVKRVCTKFLNESQAMKMLPNCFNFLTTIKMIFLESINFSLIKINTIIFVLFSKIQPKVWNLFRTNLINFVKFSTIWSSYNVSDLPKPLKIYCILCTSMRYVLFLWIKFIFLNLYIFLKNWNSKIPKYVKNCISKKAKKID